MKFLATIFKGRKFTAATLFALLAALNDALKLGIEYKTLELIAIMLGVFIGGESLADAASAVGEKWGAKAANGTVATFSMGTTTGATLTPAPPPAGT